MRTPRILLFSFLLFLWAGAETFAQQTNNPEALFKDLINKVEAEARMIKEYHENGDQFKDAKAYFLNEMEIVKTADSFLRLAKGNKNHETDAANVKPIIRGTVYNLYVGACQLVNSEPAVTVQLLEEYFRAVTSPQFSELKLTADKNAYYVYATALEQTNGDKTKIEAALKEALTSDYGVEACVKLQIIYHAREEYDSAIRDADIVIGRINSGTIKEKEIAFYLFHDKAVALFNSGQYDKAYSTYAEAEAKYPGHIELMTGASQSALKQGIIKESDPTTARQWYQKALTYLKKAEKEFPNKSEDWGFLIYQCYHLLGDSAMSTKYKKYCE